MAYLCSLIWLALLLDFIFSIDLKKLPKIQSFSFFRFTFFPSSRETKQTHSTYTVNACCWICQCMCSASWCMVVLSYVFSVCLVWGFFCQLVQVYWYIVWKLRKRNGVDDSNSIILLNFSLNQWGCNIYLNPCRFLCVSHLTLANRRIQLKSGARYYTSLLFLVIHNTALINLMPTHLFCGQQYSLQDLWL